ncbi:MAG: hypothetical protein EOO24_54445, partial [Comamonadaceae bacterium]
MSAWLDADWPAPPGVRALTTTRHGLGVSQAPFDRFNLGIRCGDAADAVIENRRQLGVALGLPASIDLQIAGPLFTQEANFALAQKMAAELRGVPGVTDVRMQQVRNTPDLRVDVDRTLAGQVGVTQRDVASSLLTSLSSSSQTSPNYWLNPTNGINYLIFVQTPQYRIGSVQDLTNTPIVPASTGGGAADAQ